MEQNIFAESFLAGREFHVIQTQSYIYSRQGEEGDGEDAEAGGNGLADPRLRNFVSVADCGDSHLKTERVDEVHLTSI